MQTKIVLAISTIIIVFVAAIAGLILYYNNIVASDNSKITQLNSQIADLNQQNAELQNQVANLSSQVNDYTTPKLVTELGVSEIPKGISSNVGSGNITHAYAHLFLQGTVYNRGNGDAYDAGLHVIGYDGDGNIKIDIIVPLTFGTTFGTTSAVISAEGTSSTELGDLFAHESANISLAIYHEGTVTHWTITPVYTSTSS